MTLTSWWPIQTMASGWWWGGPLYDAARSVSMTGDGDFIAAGNFGTDYSTGSAGLGFLARVDAAGDTIWTRTYETDGATFLLRGVQTADGGFLAVGQIQYAGGLPTQGLLLRTDAAGDTAWTRRMNREDTYPRDIELMPDGTFFVAGHSRAPQSDLDLFLVHFDAVGDTLTADSFGGPSDDRCLDMVRLAGGGFVLVGRTVVVGSAPAREGAARSAFFADAIEPGTAAARAPLSTESGYIVCLDASRAVLWEASVDDPSSVWLQGVEDAGGGRAFFSGIRNTSGPSNIIVGLADASPSGGVIWTRSLVNPHDTVCWSSAPYGPNLYLLCGNTDVTGAGDWDGLAMLVDREGDIIHQKTSGGTGGFDEFLGIAGARDQGYLAAGETWSFGAGDTDVYALRDTIPSMAWLVTSVTSGAIPLAVEFEDASTVTATGWAWDFDGDGLTDSVERNPFFIYDAPGVYAVRLTVSTGAGPYTTTRDSLITVTAPPLVADFGAAPTSGLAPLTVDFHDLSSGAPTSWAWDLDGDGEGDSAEQNPTFVYQSPGVFDVRLIVMHDTRADTLTKSAYVTAVPAVVHVSPDGSGDFATIAEAVAASVSGQVIELDDGVFAGNGNRSIEFPNRQITIRSHDGDPAACIVDCGGLYGFHIGPASAPGCALSGVTVRNAGLGAVYCDGAQAHVTACVISGNTAARGAGLYCSGASPQMTDCTFLSNVATNELSGGGAVYCRNSANPTFTDCTFIANQSPAGGALSVQVNSSATLRGCTLYGNSDGILLTYTSVLLERTIIAYSTTGAAVSSVGASITASCCDVFGNAGGPGDLEPLIGTNGNIAQDPLFCDPAAGNLTLHIGSPCLDGYDGSCGLIGAHPLGCVDAVFSGTPTIGPSPLSVQFEDLTPGTPTAWEWDFENDGHVDATVRNPVHQYAERGSYAVGLRVFDGGDLVASAVKTQYIRALGDDNMILHSSEITSASPAVVPVEFVGTTPLGALSVYLDFDPAKIAFAGIESFVPGETFVGGLVGNEVSVQWFDETGGMDPIVPGAGVDTLFAVLFANVVQSGSTHVAFNQALSVLGDANGDAIQNVSWVDEPPFGDVIIDIGAVVSGRVGYYWGDAPVPNAVLSMGPPNPDVATDEQGLYAFARYPYGNYELSISKSGDTDGINSLDAIKIVRHSTGQESLGNSYKLLAADVNLDHLINALDALRVVRAAVGLSSLPSGDWKFDPDQVAFTPLDQDQFQDFVAVRMGDVNGDWSPSGEGAPSGASAQPGVAVEDQGSIVAVQSVELAFPNTTALAGGPPADIPITVSGFDGIGAVSIRFTFAPAVMQYQSVASRVAGVTFVSNLVGDEARIEWYDATGGGNPISIGADTLLVVRFLPVGSPDDVCPLRFQSTCALGDAAGDPILGVDYSDGSCTLTGSSVGSDSPPGEPPGLSIRAASPNPFRGGSMMLLYSLPRAGEVDLGIFNVKGRRVATLVRGRRRAGQQTAVWDGAEGTRRAVSGVYFACLRFEGSSRSVKISLSR